MQRLFLPFVIFVVGLAAPLWIGAGYLGHHATGAVVAALIAVCYAVGGAELFAFRRSTRTLEASLQPPESDLGAWLARVPAELRGPLRLRVDGERVALPGPSLTPYLVGLLVLLGMLGTLLGMMATLRGTGVALQSATDLQSIRGSLASPVEGLAVAFGTSIAGVAASAMLGLLSSLLRRERTGVMQQVDACIASTFAGHSRAWQRAEALRLQQVQAQALPPLVDRLQALVETLQATQQQQGEQLLARQAEFGATSQAAQQQLAASLEAIAQRSAQDSAQALAAVVQPLLRDTLQGLTEVAERQRGHVAQAVEQQLQALQRGFDESRTAASNALASALDQQQASQQQGVHHLLDALQEAAAQQRQLSQQLLQDMTGQIAEQAARQQAQWAQVLEQQQQVATGLAQRHDQALQDALAAQQQTAAQLLEQMGQTTRTLQEHAERHETQRLEQWQQVFTAAAETARLTWQQAGERQSEQARQICATLAETGQRMADQAQTQAAATLADIGRLVDAAAQAPQAAAEVIGELRQQLSASMARDTQQLEERTQLLGTLQSLMDAVNHAANEQRDAVDALIERAAGVLQSTGEQFATQVQHGSSRLDALADQLSGGAQHVGDMAASLQAAVQAFGDAGGTLNDHLQTLAGALDASLARSDEQLAYYVAQAREVVDLTLLSQKQVLQELQQLAPASGGTAA